MNPLGSVSIPLRISREIGIRVLFENMCYAKSLYNLNCITGINTLLQIWANFL